MVNRRAEAPRRRVAGAGEDGGTLTPRRRVAGLDMMAGMAPTVHLIDASPYVFRAYHSLPPSIRTPDGRPANALRGFAHALLRLIHEEAITHAAVAFDESLTTSFRNEIHPGYKANRALPPEDLEAQLTDCRSLAEALGLATFVDERFEADDLIATHWASLRGEGASCVIVSPDKDLCQLVDEATVLLDFAAGKRFGRAEVKGKLGVEPRQVLDLLSLAGDPVDAIPGVAGVGRKTAATLLASFSDLDDLYERLDEVEALPMRGAPAVRRRLEAGREAALLSRRLAALSFEAPIGGARADDLRFTGAEPSALDAELARLGLEGLRARVPLRGAGA